MEDTLKTRYERFATTRDIYLTRARESARYTIPTLIPPEGNGAANAYPTPYQSLGSRGVNNLASKLLLALLPPNNPFFRLTVDDFQVEELKDKEARASIDEALGTIERAVANEVETTAIRVPTFQVLKHLIVGGNCLFHAKLSGGARMYPLSSYVNVRDGSGSLLEIIIHEQRSPLTLSREIIEACDVKLPGNDSAEKDVDIYTGIRLIEGTWYVYQEINNIMVPDSDGTYPKDKLPYLSLRMIPVDGEDYGRSYVEEYLGDLISLEGLQKAIVQGAAASAKLLILVKPNGTTKIKDVAQAPNGSTREGDANDVSVVTMDKSQDYRVAFDSSQEIAKRLSYAFLLNTAVQRGGERVTAEEIRYMAGELEDALGGLYSVLSQEFQLPLVKLIMDYMTSEGRLPELPKDKIKPAITTGVEALGRGHDMNKLSAFIQAAAPLGPEVLAEINIPDFVKRLATSLGIDPDGLLKSDEQREQEADEAAAAEDAARQAELVGKVAPNVASAVMPAQE